MRVLKIFVLTNRKLLIFNEERRLFFSTIGLWIVHAGFAFNGNSDGVRSEVRFL